MGIMKKMLIEEMQKEDEKKIYRCERCCEWAEEPGLCDYCQHMLNKDD